MKRTSFKKVNDLCELLNYRLVKHQRLGNAKGYYYNYSLVIDDKNGKYKETLISNKSLKYIYKWLLERG
jgi:hypothetical protein